MPTTEPFPRQNSGLPGQMVFFIFTRVCTEYACFQNAQHPAENRECCSLLWLLRACNLQQIAGLKQTLEEAGLIGKRGQNRCRKQQSGLLAHVRVYEKMSGLQTAWNIVGRESPAHLAAPR